MFVGDVFVGREPEDAEAPTKLGGVDAALRRIAKDKSPGPDELPAEVSRQPDENNRMWTAAVLTLWYRFSMVPDALVQAEGVALFEKSDPLLFGDYRPTFLLNSMYEVYATILWQRLMQVAEPIVQEIQCGFRPSRSTSQTLYCMRRSLNMLERGGVKASWHYSTRRGRSIGLGKINSGRPWPGTGCRPG